MPPRPARIPTNRSLKPEKNRRIWDGAPPMARHPPLREDLQAGDRWSQTCRAFCTPQNMIISKGPTKKWQEDVMLWKSTEFWGSIIHVETSPLPASPFCWSKFLSSANRRRGSQPEFMASTVAQQTFRQAGSGFRLPTKPLSNWWRPTSSSSHVDPSQPADLRASVVKPTLFCHPKFCLHSSACQSSPKLHSPPCKGHVATQKRPKKFAPAATSTWSVM